MSCHVMSCFNLLEDLSPAGVVWYMGLLYLADLLLIDDLHMGFVHVHVHLFVSSNRMNKSDYTYTTYRSYCIHRPF